MGKRLLSTTGVFFYSCLGIASRGGIIVSKPVKCARLGIFEWTRLLVKWVEVWQGAVVYPGLYGFLLATLVPHNCCFHIYIFFINGICSHKLLFPYYGVFHMVLRELLPASNFSRTGLPYLFDYKAIAIIRWAWSFSHVYMTPWAIMGMQWIWTVKMRIQHRSRWEHATISDAPWS